MTLTETIDSLLKDPDLVHASARRILELAASRTQGSGVHLEQDLIERLKKFLYNLEPLEHPEKGGVTACRLLAARKIAQGDWPQDVLNFFDAFPPGAP